VIGLSRLPDHAKLTVISNGPRFRYHGSDEINTAPHGDPDDIAAKCHGPNQFERFDALFRTVIAVPKATIDKAEAKWKRDRAKKKQLSGA
jgi:hypothetical protein